MVQLPNLKIVLWKNLDFNGAPDFNWINLYPPPEWDEIVTAYDYAASTFDATLKTITQRDDLRAPSCKNITEERLFDCR